MPKDKYNALVEEIAQTVGEGTSEAQINNYIAGGQIDQLINIGSVDNLTIKKKLSFFRDVKQLLVFLSIFLTVAGGLFTAYWYSVQPRKLHGDFNIAIAQFGEITDDGLKSTALSTKISNSLLNYLDTEFNASNFELKVDVSNKNMPLVTEDASAEELARKVEATVVIYGNIYVQGGEAKLSPRFYVSPKLETKELTGENELAKPITFKVATIDDQEKIEKDLKLRSAILINFTYSLIYLSEDNFEVAGEYVQDAIKIAEMPTETCINSLVELCAEKFAGKENLYLLAAHIETIQKNYDVANQMLEIAYEINPNNARAHIARGNVFYEQAIQSDPYVESLLDKALAEYKRAFEAQDQPRGANIPIKAHMSIGNILFLKAQNADNDPEFYLRAIEHYTYVADQYEKSKVLAIRELAALNYFNLGIAYERIGEVQKAIQAFENALITTSDVEFKETVENQLKTTKKSLVSP